MSDVTMQVTILRSHYVALMANAYAFEVCRQLAEPDHVQHFDAIFDECKKLFLDMGAPACPDDNTLFISEILRRLDKK